MKILSGKQHGSESTLVVLSSCKVYTNNAEAIVRAEAEQMLKGTGRVASIRPLHHREWEVTVQR